MALQKDKIASSAWFGYSSLLCSLAVWIEATVQFELRVPSYIPPLSRWVGTLALSIVLAIVEAVRGPRLWALVALWPLGTLLLLGYIVGS